MNIIKENIIVFIDSNDNTIMGEKNKNLDYKEEQLYVYNPVKVELKFNKDNSEEVKIHLYYIFSPLMQKNYKDKIQVIYNKQNIIQWDRQLLSDDMYDAYIKMFKYQEIPLNNQENKST